MKEIIWGHRNPAPALKINGREYPLRLSEAKLLQITHDVCQSFRQLSTAKLNEEVIIGATANAVSAIEQILGQGALEEITSEAPVSVAETLELLDVIVEAALEEYADKLAEMHA